MVSPALGKLPLVRLGKSGLKVSKIILGCMSYGSDTWQPWVLGEQEGIDHIKAALELGITTFDTANVYSNGLSEVVLGKALKQLQVPREEVVILTKVYFPVGRGTENVLADPRHSSLDARGYANQYGLSRKHIFDSVKASLERLQVDYVDVLQCHRFDYETPIEETMEALHDVVKAGLVRYIGMSSCYAYQFWQMQSYAIQHNLTPFISLQPLYNAVYREEEREMLPTLRHFGVGCIPWSPLARGYLTRPLSQQKETSRGGTDKFLSLMVGESGQQINQVIEELAKQKGKTMAQVALAYVLAKPDITAPIIGSTKIDSIRELVDAVTVEMSAEDIQRIDDLYKPRPVVGPKKSANE